jgi:hypothetical protein
VIDLELHQVLDLVVRNAGRVQHPPSVDEQRRSLRDIQGLSQHHGLFHPGFRLRLGGTTGNRFRIHAGLRGQTQASEEETGGRLPRSSRKVCKCQVESVASGSKNVCIALPEKYIE